MAGLFLLGKVLKPCIHTGCRENIFVEKMGKVLQKYNEGVIIKTWSRKTLTMEGGEKHEHDS